MMKNVAKPEVSKAVGQTALFRTEAMRIREPRGDFGLLVSAITGVLRHAQEGKLPLFAWTLGLPQTTWLTMLEALFPELGALEPLPSRAYAAIERRAPKIFLDLAFTLFEYRSMAVNEQHAGWLARAIAAGCLGCRHLWQDLGLRDQGEVSALLAGYFPLLHAKNVHHLKWKRFLFAELSTQQNIPEILPPHCDKCDDFPMCFPTAARAKRHLQETRLNGSQNPI